MKKAKMLTCHTIGTLTYLVNQASIAFHLWHSRQGALHKPDVIVFDLDPPGNNTQQLIVGCKELDGLCRKKGYTPFVMTTGSKGLHVRVPIKPVHDFDTVREAIKEIGKELEKNHPALWTLVERREKRQGKLYFDYKRASYGMMTIAPYSLRSLPYAPVALPLSWEELNKNGFDPKICTLKNISYRLESIEDLWKGFFRHKSTLQ